MGKRSVLLRFFFLLALISLVLPATLHAVIQSETQAAARRQKEEQLCDRIRDRAAAGQDVRKLVKTGIQMGYGACGAIKCAISSGGDLKEIATAAVEAGATKDVVARCSLDGCLEKSDKSSAKGNARDKKSAEEAADKKQGLCTRINEQFKAGSDVRKIVKSSLTAGNDICDVTACARRSGAGMDQIAAGAADAGRSRDEVSKCPSDSCARDIAEIINTLTAAGICYIMPEEPEVIAFPTGFDRGSVVSPSGF